MNAIGYSWNRLARNGQGLCVHDRTGHVVLQSDSNNQPEVNRRVFRHIPRSNSHIVKLFAQYRAAASREVAIDDGPVQLVKRPRLDWATVVERETGPGRPAKACSSCCAGRARGHADPSTRGSEAISPLGCCYITTITLPHCHRSSLGRQGYHGFYRDV